MLGIVFTGGKGPPPQLIQKIARERGTNVLLAAADSGLELAESAGLRPDWIIGDMDSLKDSSRLNAYPQERIIRHPQDKDYTDTELALSLLREKGCGEIWIIGGGGGRVDHLFGIRSLFERNFFPSRWILDMADIYCLEAARGRQGKNSGASPGTLNLCLGTGDLVSVFPLGTGPWKVSSSGLRWPLDDLNWEKGFFGLSNIAQSGTIMLNLIQGRFMVIIPYSSRE